MATTARNFIALAGLVTILTIGGASDVHAQGFISPLVGYNFGGDSGNCPSISDCEDKRANFGVAFGTLGTILGFETELAYAKDFFGAAPGFESSVFTLMGNVMIVPATDPVRPYALVGLGLIKSRVELTPSSLLEADNNDFGWDIGGGLFIFFSPHVGVRGDIRYFHSFKDRSILGISLSDTKLDFGRAAGTLVLKF